MYIKPSIEIIDIEAEGIICASGINDNFFGNGQGNENLKEEEGFGGFN